jgi:hypothetical protein
MDAPAMLVRNADYTGFSLLVFQSPPKLGTETREHRCPWFFCVAPVSPGKNKKTTTRSETHKISEKAQRIKEIDTAHSLASGWSMEWGSLRLPLDYWPENSGNRLLIR